MVFVVSISEIPETQVYRSFYMQTFWVLLYGQATSGTWNSVFGWSRGWKVVSKRVGELKKKTLSGRNKSCVDHFSSVVRRENKIVSRYTEIGCELNLVTNLALTLHSLSFAFRSCTLHNPWRIFCGISRTKTFRAQPPRLSTRVQNPAVSFVR